MEINFFSLGTNFPPLPAALNDTKQENSVLQQPDFKQDTSRRNSTVMGWHIFYIKSYSVRRVRKNKKLFYVLVPRSLLFCRNSILRLI